jgi:hypothetical protein
VINPVGPSSHLEKKKEKNKTYEVKANILLGILYFHSGRN